MKPGIILICSVILSTACNSILDVKPESDITNSNYWKSEGDVTGYITGIYTQLRDVNNSTYYFEDRGDAFIAGLEGGMSNVWQQNLNEANAPSWLGFYNLVYHCNLLLKNGKDIPFSVQANKDRVMAEAHFLRAYAYFLLTRIWGDVPIELQPAVDDNPPLTARSPATDVMQLILSDVDSAIALFPEDGFKDKSRASKPAAWALRADALLWKAKVLNGGEADLQAALTAIDNATAGVSLQPSLERVHATDNRNNSEVIFSIHFQRDERSDSYGSRLKPRDIFVQNAVNKSSIAFAKNGARSMYMPSPRLDTLFDKYPGDTRKDQSIIKAIDANGEVMGVFDNKLRGTAYSDDRYFDNDQIVYRLGGLLLLKAEALAALNRVPEAITALNRVRGRAGIGDYPGATDKTTVEKEILDERFRELYMELKRWPDLLRFHFGGTINVYNVVPNLQGKQLPLFFPIRRAFIDINPNLEQTEGY